MFRILSVAMAATLLAFGGNAFTATTAEAKTCIKYRVAGTGEPLKLRVRAASAARREWKERVKAIVGTKFDTWIFAKGRVVNCQPLGDARYQCTALATPCRGLI